MSHYYYYYYYYFIIIIIIIIIKLIKFDNVSRAMTAKISAKKCVARSEFLFCLFSRFRRICGYAELASGVTRPRKTILDMRRFRLKNQRFDG